MNKHEIGASAPPAPPNLQEVLEQTNRTDEIDNSYASSPMRNTAFASHAANSAQQPTQQHQQYYNQSQAQSHTQYQQSRQPQITLTSLSEKYSTAFKNVDDRISSYLARFLRRAKQGPEQERQLLQVIQVEIRDLLRRTLDAEADTIQVGELLNESHARQQVHTQTAAEHLHKVQAAQEERTRELKLKFESELKEKQVSERGEPATQYSTTEECERSG